MGGRGGSGGRGMNLNTVFGKDADAWRDYFSDTNVPVTYNLNKWVEEADTLGVPDSAYWYMNNSSINDRMAEGKLRDIDYYHLDTLKRFTLSGKVPAGTVLYSGLSSQYAKNIWDKKPGEKVTLKSFLSTSPDPNYASGYGENTHTMVKITTNRPIRVGKMYYESEDGTEAVVNPHYSYTVRKKYYRKVWGRRMKIIEVTVN